MRIKKKKKEKKRRVRCRNRRVCFGASSSVVHESACVRATMVRVNPLLRVMTKKWFIFPLFYCKYCWRVPWKKKKSSVEETNRRRVVTVALLANVVLLANVQVVGFQPVVHSCFSPARLLFSKRIPSRKYSWNLVARHEDLLPRLR